MKGLAPNLVGALWMLGSALVLTVQGSLVKHLGLDLPVVMILFLRVILILSIAAPLAMHRIGLSGLRTQRPGAHIGRTVFGLGMMACTFYAITVLPLADATALSFTRPLWSMLTSYLAFGEVVGWLGGFATVSGFGGVLVVVQPQSGIHHGMIIALAGAASSSLALVFIKKLTRTEPVARILFYFSAICAVILVGPAILWWQTPTLTQLAWLCLMAICGSAGQLMSSLAVKYGDMTVVTPIDFIRVPAAAAIGFVVFGESPTLWTFVGTAIIFVATIIVLNIRRRRPAALPLDEPTAVGAHKTGTIPGD
ncbi:MAG: DMT family transporter [Aurantimonas coralicida]